MEPRIARFMDPDEVFPALKESIENALFQQEEKRCALLIFTPGQDLYPQFKRAIEGKEGDAIFIDCRQNSFLSGFPSHSILSQLEEGLRKAGVEYDLDYPEFKTYEKRYDLETHEDFELGRFKKAFYELEPKKPLYLLIGNADAPYSNDFSLTFHRHFIFDKRRLPENLHVLFLSGDPDYVRDNEEMLEAITLEAPKEDPIPCFLSILEKHGRKLTKYDLGDMNPNLTLADYLDVAAMAIDYAGEKDYKPLAKELLSCPNSDALLSQTLEFFLGRLSEPGKALFAEALLDLYVFPLGLTADQILQSGRYLLSGRLAKMVGYDEIDPLEGERLLAYLRFYAEIEAERYWIRSERIKRFVGENSLMLSRIVTEAYPARILNAVAYSKPRSKAQYLNSLEQEGRFLKKNLTRYALFEPLCLRLLDLICHYAGMLELEPGSNRVELSSLEQMMLVYIDVATHRFGEYGFPQFIAEVLSHEELVYFVMSKSHRLFRRMLTRYVDASKGIEGKTIAKSLQSALSFASPQNERYDVSLVLGSVLYENDILFRGKLKDYCDDHSLSPLTDFTVLAGRDGDVQILYDLETRRDLDDEDIQALIADLKRFSSDYEEEQNYFRKLILAYYCFRIFFTLGEKKRYDTKLSVYLETILQDVLVYVEYCYFPEVRGLIYACFGRTYPEDYLSRLNEGVYYAQSQGYRRSIRSLEKALRYFEALKEGRE